MHYMKLWHLFDILSESTKVFNCWDINFIIKYYLLFYYRALHACLLSIGLKYFESHIRGLWKFWGDFHEKARASTGIVQNWHLSVKILDGCTGPWIFHWIWNWHWYLRILAFKQAIFIKKLSNVTHIKTLPPTLNIKHHNCSTHTQ